MATACHLVHKLSYYRPVRSFTSLITAELTVPIAMLSLAVASFAITLPTGVSRRFTAYEIKAICEAHKEV